MPTPELQEFFAKIQGADEGAVEAMLQELDPFLRRVIRLRLLDGRFRRAVDTTDILQSTRLLFDLKAQGLTWHEVAAKAGGRADALRMRLNRAVAAVLTELGDKG